MAMKLETPASEDFSAEVSEWIEAFDDVVADDWEHGAKLLEALRQRARDHIGTAARRKGQREVS